MNLSGDEEKKRLTEERSRKTEDTRRKGEPSLPSALASHYFSQVSVYMFNLIFLAKFLILFSYMTLLHCNVRCQRSN